MQSLFKICEDSQRVDRSHHMEMKESFAFHLEVEASQFAGKVERLRLELFEVQYSFPSR